MYTMNIHYAHISRGGGEGEDVDCYTKYDI